MLDIKARNVLLKEDSNKAFYLVASNEEEIQGIQKAIEESDGSIYPFFNQVEVLGRSKEANLHVANRYIPIDRIRERCETSDDNINAKHHWIEVEYTCYCRGKRIPENNIIIHEEPLSALKCAIYKIGDPDYVYIIRVKKENEFKDNVEQIKENYDSSGNPSICEEGTDVKEST